ncbi:MAG: 2-oxoglutarate dehydrogenase complex dihydrolipoyllysine-residue succinyltransferase [Deltaproteobacteria bacterium]|nr:2-oxoglutarate dehydrogenase complex dihydrolipoyllysine-residue succinyltransferase [Deltaproteobacteria bacterium]
MSIAMKAPSPGESITEVQIAKWFKADGDPVAQDEPLCEIESDKATLEITAEAAGEVHIVAAEGEIVPVGAVICTIDPSAAGATPVKRAEISSRDETRKAEDESLGVASPAAGKILREKEIMPASVSGTGRGGRITKTDALAAQPLDTPEVRPQEMPAEPPADPHRPVRRVPLSMLRRSLAKRMVAVKNETAMLTTFNEVDMSAVMALRRATQDAFQQKFHVKLGLLSFFARAAVQALLAFPAVNARIDEGTIVYQDFIDIGIAVSAPKGLMVPVLHNVERMHAGEIEQQIRHLAERAQAGQLGIAEMSGGTFTITNGGVFGSMLSTPLINPPQSAILGMHNIVERPVALDGKVVIRPIMYVALSYDHRMIDGRESVGFLKRVKEEIESPERLLTGL